MLKDKEILIVKYQEDIKAKELVISEKIEKLRETHESYTQQLNETADEKEKLVYDHQEYINDLEIHYQKEFDNLKQYYETRLEEKNNEIGKINMHFKPIETIKADIHKDYHTKKMQKDMVTHQNILQEIKRFEKNMQEKPVKDILTLSQLKTSTKSTANLSKIQDLVTVSI